MDDARVFSSSAYWEARYCAGGMSGAGSVGPLARFKAGFINRFFADNGIDSVVDIGCGDGKQLSLLKPPLNYVGVDVSAIALAHCITRFPNHRFVLYEEIGTVSKADLTLSLDVIYHLVEDAVFIAMMQRLFELATRFVVIYASNAEAGWPGLHVRHRRFTDYVSASEPAWQLLAHVPNPCPFDPARPNETSFADFFVYGRLGAACTLHIPAGHIPAGHIPAGHIPAGHIPAGHIPAGHIPAGHIPAAD